MRNELTAQETKMLSKAADLILKVQMTHIEFDDLIDDNVSELGNDLLEVRMKLLQLLRRYGVNE